MTSRSPKGKRRTAIRHFIPEERLYCSTRSKHVSDRLRLLKGPQIRKRGSGNPITLINQTVPLRLAID